MDAEYPETVRHVEVVTTAVRNPDPKPLSTRDRALAEVRRKGIRPFDSERYKADHKPGFESDEECEAFIADIYAERRKNLA